MTHVQTSKNILAIYFGFEEIWIYENGLKLVRIRDRIFRTHTYLNYQNFTFTTHTHSRDVRLIREEGLFLREGWSQLRGWMKVERPYCNIPCRCFICHYVRQTGHSSYLSPSYILFATLPNSPSTVPIFPPYTPLYSHYDIKIISSNFMLTIFETMNDFGINLHFHITL